LPVLISKVSSLERSSHHSANYEYAFWEASQERGKKIESDRERQDGPSKSKQVHADIAA